MPHPAIPPSAARLLLAGALCGPALGLCAATAAEPSSVASEASTASSPASAAVVPQPAPALPSAAPAEQAAASAVPPALPASAPAAPRPRKAAASSPGGPAWSSLSAVQRAALRPLQRDWAGIDAARKQKWLEIAQRFEKLTPAEQARLHQRMTEWARLSPEQRSTARLTFQEAQHLPPQVRQDRWAAYLALPEPERQQLASQAERQPGKTVRAAPRGTIAGSSLAKSNIVPNPLHAMPPQPVGPALLRAGPGATTTPLRHLSQPPQHQQPGLPKVAATPDFVDGTTLAPRVGPQALGAAAPERRQPR